MFKKETHSAQSTPLHVLGDQHIAEHLYRLLCRWLQYCEGKEMLTNQPDWELIFGTKESVLGAYMKLSKHLATLSDAGAEEESITELDWSLLRAAIKRMDGTAVQNDKVAGNHAHATPKKRATKRLPTSLGESVDTDKQKKHA